MKKIEMFSVTITWDDGETEGVAVHLPEHIKIELQRYFQELEDLREERDEGYSFEPEHAIKLDENNFSPNAFKPNKDPKQIEIDNLRAELKYFYEGRA